MRRWWMMLLLGACSAPEADGPMVLLDPPAVDLGRLYPGESASSTLVLAPLGGVGGVPTVQAIRIDGSGADWLRTGPVDTLLSEPIPIELVLQIPAEAPAGPQSATLSVTGAADGASFEVRSRITFDTRSCDADGDGDSVIACGGGDCDDADPAISSEAAELCNGIDDDCNGIVDDVADLDGDGFYLCEDCNDEDPDIRPGAPERCNGIDDDCDGEPAPDEIDGDGDGFSTCEGDCNDLDPRVAPGATELCNGIDDDCDGLTDDVEDGDGDSFTVCEDCDDTDRETYPGAPEQCDGIDNDCDGELPASEADLDGDGVALCERDCDDDDDERFPGNPERCNGFDDDCDEIIDEVGACPCTRVERDDSLYLICNSPRGWTAAQSQCRGWGYDLLTIDDADEDSFATDEVRDSDPDTRWWMGLNDRTTEGTWEWEDGTSVRYTNWEPGEPNDLGGEDCGQLNFFESGRWNDQACTLSYPFVCELD